MSGFPDIHRRKTELGLEHGEANASQQLDVKGGRLGLGA